MASKNQGLAIGYALSLSALALGSAILQALRLPSGLEYVRIDQLQRHQEVLSGQAPDPWGYRWLSEIAASPFVSLSEAFTGDVLIGFLVFRTLQNLLIALLLWLWLGAQGITSSAKLIGIALFFYASVNAIFDSDLSLNTYGDVAFALAVAILISRNHPLIAIVLLIVGIQNRETLLISSVFMLTFLPRTLSARAGWFFGALAAGSLSYLAVRILASPRELLRPYGIDPGLDLLEYNLSIQSFRELAITYLPLVILAIAGWRYATSGLRLSLWLVVLPWVAIHMLVSVIAESRLFLVIAAVILIPMALAPLSQARSAPNEQSGFGIPDRGESPQQSSDA